MNHCFLKLEGGGVNLKSQNKIQNKTKKEKENTNFEIFECRFKYFYLINK